MKRIDPVTRAMRLIKEALGILERIKPEEKQPKKVVAKKAKKK